MDHQSRLKFAGRDKKIMIDVWVKQSDLMWRTVYATPAIATALFAGWYAVLDTRMVLANFILAAGILMMGVQGLILHRMANYLNALRQEAGSALPPVPRPVWVKKLKGPAGYQLAVAVPAILGALFAIMLMLSLLGL